MLKRINNTFIILILKKGDFQNINDLGRLVCVMLYKIISKVMANKLKEVLEKRISQFQSAFIEDRYIADNYFVTLEILHSFKKRSRATES